MAGLILSDDGLRDLLGPHHDTIVNALDEESREVELSPEYRAGWDDGFDGRPRTDCPHAEGTPKRLCWMLGYNVGETRREVIRSRRW